jgi:hypothetical protein
MNYDGGMKDKPVVGQNTIPDIHDRVRWSGQLSALFDRRHLSRRVPERDTAVSFTVWLTTSNAAAADFIGFTVYNAKLNGTSKSDGEDGLELTIPFHRALQFGRRLGHLERADHVLIQDSLVP